MIEIYQKDNLELLRELPSNHLDLIYCDILYGTGKKFKDYQDLKPDKEIFNSFYIERFKEMYRILTEKGTLYIQTSIISSHWVRLMLDDIFGSDMFRNEIVVCFNIGGFGKKEFPKKT